jgi:hypothetical protein
LHEKYSATYVLQSSVSSIMSMDARKNWSGLYSRIGISDHSILSEVSASRDLLEECTTYIFF